jgi:hypothetical protein
MDVFSLLLPRDCKIPSPQVVSCVGSPDYDYELFAEYPIRQGFSLSPECILVNQEGRYEETTAFIQSWCFFGLIGAMLDHAHGLLQLSDLITEDSHGNKCINGAFTGQLIENWHPRALKQSLTSDWPAHYEYYRTSLDLASRNARMLDFDLKEKPESSTIRALIVLSIQACVRAFTLKLTEITGSIQATETLVALETCDYISPSALMAKKFMIDNGWCPVRAGRFVESHCIEDVYTAAAVGGHFKQDLDHKDCSLVQGCVASNINNATFRSLHARQNCHCDLVTLDMESVRAVLRKGQIPIVVLERDGSGKRSMTISPVSGLTEYTAISHVWSDGMADPRQNGLLECQLTKLEGDLRILQGRQQDSAETGKYTLKFWIDAFCVPCDDRSSIQESMELKLKAIQLMALTYAAASEVLVVDKRVEAVSYCIVGSDTLAETWKAASNVCAWLRFLTWMTRCWTLQEASLARALYVRCAGPALWVHSNQLFLSSRDDPPTFVTSLNQLLGRDTSQSEDLHKILANICGLDASEISNLHQP